MANAQASVHVAKSKMPASAIVSYRKTRGGGGYCHIWAIEVCAAVKGMVFKQFTLG